MANEIEIIATPSHERHRFHNSDGDVAIFSAVVDGAEAEAADVSLKGPADDNEPALQLPYRFYGRWTNYKNKRTGITEKQFAYSSMIRSGNPKGRSAIVAYLSCCQGIGKVLAGRIYAALGESSLRVCREEPEAAAEQVSRLDLKQAESLAAWLEENSRLEEIMVEMAGLLKGRGFPRELPKLVVAEWGNKAPEIIRRNPYRLMEFSGVGFSKADALYLELGHSPDRLKRQTLCCVHAIANAPNGDTWQYVEVARQAVRQNIAGTAARPEDAIRLAVRAGLLTPLYTDGINGPPDMLGDTYWLSSAKQAKSERIVAEETQRIMASGARWPAPNDDSLSLHQSNQMFAAIASSPMGVLAGSPGTGKTYTAATIVRAIIDYAGVEQVRIAAPTGKAAVRLTESMDLAGVPVTATTIHSLLGSDGSSFGFGKLNPLDGMFFILDESSMIDTDLMASFLSAVPEGGRVLLIGDTNQLLPVGHGAPLRDMVAGGVPTGELTEVRRNAGAIVEACAAIRRNESFKIDGNLSLLNGETAVDIVRECQSTWGFDPIWEVQLVTAVNTKSDLSRRALNEQLQAALNTNEERTGPFRLGDKVICTKNGWLKPMGEPGPGVVVNQDGDVRVANGEIGRVDAIDGKRMHVSLQSPGRVVRVPVGFKRGESEEGDTGCNFDLAYAISVHKSQGSEFPCVVICLDPSPAAGRVGDRAWIYTAISRAKQQCVLWGDLKVASKWCARNRIAMRKTFLRERIERMEAVTV